MVLIPTIFFSVGLLFYGWIKYFSPQHKIDFSTTESMQTTCESLMQTKLTSLLNDEEKVALVICRAIELTKDTLFLVKKADKDKVFSNEELLIKTINDQIQKSLSHIKTSRKILQTVYLREPVFTVYPGNWAVDLDGNGETTLFERYFFWIPRHGEEIPSRFASGLDRESYYQRYFANTKIKIDQSDVYWALAYCHFAEGILNLASAYDGTLFAFTLKESQKVMIAYEHFLDALGYSKKLRESLQQEKDDEQEWIPNGKQQDTAFPITMDEQLFQTWGILLDEIEELLMGKTLLGGAILSKEGGMVRKLSPCSLEEGINVYELFKQPLDFSKENIYSRCKVPSEKIPFSKMGQTLTEVYQRNSREQVDQWDNELSILRYLYWIN